MGILRIIKNNFVEKLPRKYQLSIERLYLERLYSYFNSDPTYQNMKYELKLLKQLCNPQNISLDIGANKGLFTLFLCKFSSHVYCFEPIPELCTFLIRKFQGTNVTIENCALGNVNDYSYINIPYTGNIQLLDFSSLAVEYNNQLIQGEKVTCVKKQKVKVKRLDNFHISNIGFIKIDVEGYELQVLEGAQKTIQQNMPHIYIEIEQRYHKEKNIYDIFQYIIDMGYFGYFIYNKKIKKIDEFDISTMQNEKNKKSKDYINDFIFSPSSIIVN